MSRRGFTLLEAVVALAIAAVMLTALYGALARAGTAHGRAEQAVDRLAAARTALLRLGDEVEAALPAPEPAAPERFVVRAPQADAPPWSTLRFATLTTADEPRLVAYRVEGAGDGAALVRASASRFAPPDAPEPTGVTLVEGVHVFRVRALDREGWHPAWTTPDLPRAVEIVLGVDDGAGGTEELATTVALARGASR